MSAVALQERLVEVPAETSEPAAREPAGEQKSFRPYDPEQVLLMAPVLQEWIPEGDLAHFVSDLVESGALDLGEIYASYEEERGYPPYDPRLRGGRDRRQDRYARHTGRCICDLAEVLSLAGKPDEAAAALEQALERYERKGNLVSAQRSRTRLAELREAAPS